ncbi:MAG: FkbM family methyltransferase [Pyrinomonadaceae bacterium]
MGKLTTARRVFRAQGLNGILSALKDGYLGKWLGDEDNWWYGKLIEMRGNVVRIEGCSFSLDSPVIGTALKSNFILNRYERPEREALRRFLDPDLPVIEFGGSVGVVACLTNRKLNDPRRHVVVEANPALIPLLKKNRDLNGCEFEILPRMVGYGSEQSTFYPNSVYFLASTAIPPASGEADVVLKVQTVNLQSILDQYKFDRCTLICDIEGGEADLVRHEAHLLKERVATIILEVHEWSLGEEKVAGMLREIESLGFKTVYSEAQTYVFQKES